MVWITTLAGKHGEVSVLPGARLEDGLPGRPPTLLIIEDDPTARLALACMVADSRCQVVLASSAEEAMECLPLVDPDLILCDYVLDGMNGREFCQEMKSSARWRYVPVIVVTAMDAQSIVADLLRSGADDVLAKPVRAGELRARVMAALRTRRQYLDLAGMPSPSPPVIQRRVLDAYA